MEKFYTCPICETKVPIIMDSKMRLCDCKKFGVDCAKEYTRFIGYVPMEDPGYELWYQRSEPVITALKIEYQKKK